MKRFMALASLVLLLAVTLGACRGDTERAVARGNSSSAESREKPDKPNAQDKARRVPSHQPPKTNCDEAAPTFNAAWRESPKSIKEGAKKAKDVVEATVSDVRPGTDVVIPAPQEPGGEYRVPTQRVRVKVTKKYKGDAAVGETLTLFQTGSACESVAGDPPYKKGERHLLMLTDGPRGQHRTIAPEGRAREKADGTLDPATHGPVARQYKGKKPKDLEEDLRG